MSVGFAIVGAGNVAGVQVEAIRHIPEARVVVVTGRSEMTGRALAESCGADWTSDLEAAVSRSDVDIVSVCTPSGPHLEPAVVAAEAGKHLMIEKPIEITLHRVDAIIEAAERNGSTLTCFFPSRFMLGVEKTREAVAQGRLGRLVYGDAFIKWFRPQEYYDVGWRGSWALDGGGALMNQSVHSIDLLRWLVGPVESLFARVTTLSHDMETEDTAAVLLSFRGGGLGVIQGSTSCWPGDPARVELRGTKGTIVLEEGRIVTWRLEGASEEEEACMLGLEEASGSGSADPMGIGYERHRKQIVDLISALREGREPVVSGTEARKSVEIVLAIYESARTGTPISLRAR